MPETSRPIPGEPVRRGSFTMYDDSKTPPGEYRQEGKGTVLPRSTPTGGIEGGADVTAISRTLEWNEETKTFTPKNIREVSMSQTAAVLDVLVEKSKEIKQEQAGNEAGRQLDAILEDKPEPAIPIEQASDAKVDELTRLVKSLLKQQVVPAAQVKPAAPVVKIAVEYEGSFGNIKAAYKRVIINANCIALIRGANDDYFYSPPKDMEKEFQITVQMPNGPEVMKVLNPGLEFLYSDIQEYILVLLRVD